MNTLMKKFSSLWLASLAVGAAQAHVTLEQPQAPAGSSYKAVLRVGHGCNGQPTQTITVQVPAGLRGAKPVPKAGWALSLRSEKLAQPYDKHGVLMSEAVTEISWQARSRSDWLDDAHYDEFVLRGQLPAQAGLLWFKVRQACESAVINWADVPAEGSQTRGLKAPAALLEVMPAAPAAHHH